jgi:hypothetical protein
MTLQSACSDTTAAAATQRPQASRALVVRSMIDPSRPSHKSIELKVLPGGLYNQGMKICFNLGVQADWREGDEVSVVNNPDISLSECCINLSAAGRAATSEAAHNLGEPS